MSQRPSVLRQRVVTCTVSPSPQQQDCTGCCAVICSCFTLHLKHRPLSCTSISCYRNSCACTGFKCAQSIVESEDSACPICENVITKRWATECVCSAADHLLQEQPQQLTGCCTDHTTGLQCMQLSYLCCVQQCEGGQCAGRELSV